MFIVKCCYVYEVEKGLIVGGERDSCDFFSVISSVIDVVEIYNNVFVLVVEVLNDCKLVIRIVICVF